MNKPTWTPEQDAVLIRMRGEGRTFVEIGAAVGMGRAAASGRARRLQEAGVEIPIPVMRARPVASAAENTGTGKWDRSAREEPQPWRLVDARVWSPLECSAPVSIVDRAPCACAWPVGGDGADMMACAAPVKPGSSYCATHHRLAWIPLKTSQRVYSRRVERIAARC